MSSITLSEDQRDALQEITNIGMGRAGDSIARIFNEFVELSVPCIQMVEGSQIAAKITDTVGDKEVSGVRQPFHGYLRGEVLMVYDHRHCNELSELFGYENNLSEVSNTELLLDVTNVLVGACLGGMAEQLQVDIGFSAPSLMGGHAPASALLRTAQIETRYALFVEVNFTLEKRRFHCHLIILMPDAQFSLVEHAINSFIDRF